MYDHIRAALRVSTGSEMQAQIDLNARTPDGLTPVPTDLVTSGAQAGMVIRVFEPEDEVAGIGQIERIDRDAGLVYIRVDWNSIGDASQVEPIARSMSIVYGGPGRGGTGTSSGRIWAKHQKVVTVDRSSGSNAL